MFFLVNKPKWVTSHDVVDKFKRIFHWEKIWHSGTLDPMATGLLIIAIKRESTKHLGKLLWMDKTYITEIDFSILTDTWDMDYYDTIINYELWIMNSKKWIIKDWKFIVSPSLEEIKNKLDLLIPECELPLTMFSAKKRDGKKLYELARQGIDLKLKQVMKINSYEILAYDFPKLKLKLNVGSGTYIRSIWYWLWQQLWLGWTLIMLHRESIGPFRLNKNNNIS